MPPRRQPPLLPLPPQDLAPQSSTPSPNDSPPPPPPPPPPPLMNQASGSGTTPTLDPTTIALVTLLSSQMTSQMKEAIPEMFLRLRNEILNTGNTSGEASGNTGDSSHYSYKSFVGCKPPSFSGSEGAVGLIQWIEKIETTLDLYSCPEHHKVRYSAGTFNKRALTWWNGQINAQGREEAMAMPWEDFKALLRTEFCPKNELQKLEVELSNHVMKGADHMGYTTRYHELVALVPDMVPTLEKRIDRYVGGLPTCIQGMVVSANPTTVESAVRLSGKLTDLMVASGVLKKEAEPSKNKAEASKKPHHHQKKKQKTIKNYTVATPLQQVAAAPQNPNLKPYTNTFPLCAKCQYHHAANTPCKHCTGCGRKGHWVQYCRVTPNQAVNNAALALPPPANQNHGGCYNCGEQGHFAKNCPKKAQPAVQAPRGRAFAIGAPAARQDPNVWHDFIS
ncbi:hypothetical protein E3N88_18595 [Mikania micrantha]|uniref:CCHC-type domain-containing protein n=1 Tax=Mikania micrantha TaxID=192012 RepID=A0A5N6NMA0_9ASTR|nr:hypothetical protein E3N88_18595 [Mikania micrantha]